MSANRLTHLDGLRAIAALMVVFEHIFKTFFAPLFNEDLGFAGYTLIETMGSGILSIATNGKIAVALFFVLSGFVVFKKLLTLNGLSDWIEFIFQRYARIAIPVLLVFLAYFALTPYLISGYDSLSANQHSYIERPSAITLYDAFSYGLFKSLFELHTNHLPILWTMSFEMIASVALWAVSIVFLMVNTNKRLLGASMLMVLLFYTANSIYSLFILGALLNFIPRFKTKQDAYMSNSILFACGCLYLLLTPAFVSLFDLAFERNGYLVFGWVGALLIYSSNGSSWLKGLLNHRSLQKIGGYSFELYLTHYFVILMMYPFIQEVSMAWSLSGFEKLVLSVSSILAISFVVMIAFQKLLTRPVTLFSKNQISKLIKYCSIKANQNIHDINAAVGSS